MEISDDPFFVSMRGTPASALRTEASMGDAIVEIAGKDLVDVVSSEAIVSELQSAGSGSRGIAVYRLPSGRQHAVNAINHEGQILFIDAQAGGEAILSGTSDFAFVRTN
jgi:hypothetical protein